MRFTTVFLSTALAPALLLFGGGCASTESVAVPSATTVVEAPIAVTVPSDRGATSSPCGYCTLDGLVLPVCGGDAR